MAGAGQITILAMAAAAPAAPASVPTLGPWGQITLANLLALGGTTMLRRKRKDGDTGR